MGKVIRLTESDLIKIVKRVIKENVNKGGPPRFWQDFVQELVEGWKEKITVSQTGLQVTYKGTMFRLDIKNQNGLIEYVVVFNPNYDKQLLLESINNAYFAYYKLNNTSVVNILKNKNQIPGLKVFKSSIQDITDLGFTRAPAKNFFEELMAIDSNPANQESYKVGGDDRFDFGDESN